ncbi:MAG TPA: SAF domain-containing protein, partial [Clostridia bacterium]|nr:SAF domain-containing protein [Clostridia bacterium]
MTKKRTKIIALIFTIILTIVFYISVSNTSGKDADNSGNLGDVGVIIVNKDIPPYTEITDELISEKKMVLSKDVKGYFTKKKDVIGKVSTSHLYSGEI